MTSLINDVGMREAKGRFSELAAQANATGLDVLVRKNNKPWVKIVPVAHGSHAQLVDFDSFVVRLESANTGRSWSADISDKELLNEERLLRFG